MSISLLAISNFAYCPHSWIFNAVSYVGNPLASNIEITFSCPIIGLFDETMSSFSFVSFPHSIPTTSDRNLLIPTFRSCIAHCSLSSSGDDVDATCRFSMSKAFSLHIVEMQLNDCDEINGSEFLLLVSLSRLFLQLLDRFLFFFAIISDWWTTDSYGGGRSSWSKSMGCDWHSSNVVFVS